LVKYRNTTGYAVLGKSQKNCNDTVTGHTGTGKPSKAFSPNIPKKIVTNRKTMLK
jgi:hypothetical protein